jgi:protein-L-isoaspartate(D-aspartate) O-methyltransferase
MRDGKPVLCSESALEAVAQTERHRFIPGRSCSVAYRDGPLPIGQGQTISQPYIVALMTDLAAVKSDDTVLEVGTGSGYQAAILARLVRKVCTVEIIPPLAEAAATGLKELGHDNVSVRVGEPLVVLARPNDATQQDSYGSRSNRSMILSAPRAPSATVK